MNQLYYGDNLEALRRYIKDDSVDLVYLDPPFKSNQDYNVLFAEKDGAGRPPSSKPSKTLGNGLRHHVSGNRRADSYEPFECRD